MSRRPPEPTGRCVLLCSCLLSFLPAVATVDVAFGCLGVSLAILGGVKQLAIDRCDYKPHSRTNPANSHSLFLTQDCPRPVFQPSQNYRLLFLPLPPLGFPVEPLQIAAGLAGNNFDLLASRHRSPMKVSDSLWDRINFITDDSGLWKSENRFIADIFVSFS